MFTPRTLFLPLLLVAGTAAAQPNTWVRSGTLNGPARHDALGFTIGDKVYTCLGLDQAGDTLTDLWAYDPALETWTEKAALPGVPRTGAVTCTIVALACVSTLEHIGFDVASPPEVTETAFVRAKTPEEAVSVRDPETDRRFLDAAARLIEPGGSLLVSVPAGFGVPILHQDSLGLFTHQFEYDEPSWRALVSDERFTVVEEAYFRHDDVEGWQAVAE